MRDPVFYGIVKSSKIKLDNKIRFMDYLSSLEGQRVEVVIRKRNPSRTEHANNFYHGVVVPLIADHLGYTHDECHDAIKEKFSIKSTARMKVDEFSRFLEGVIRWSAQDLGVPIPDPKNIDY
jgi:hypothetical protein